jgi:hypothetical protein
MPAALLRPLSAERTVGASDNGAEYIACKAIHRWHWCRKAPAGGRSAERCCRRCDSLLLLSAALYVASCTLYVASCTLCCVRSGARCPLSVASSALCRRLCLAHRLLSVARRLVSVACCTSYVARCMLYTAVVCCMLYAVCCMLSVARRLLSVAAACCTDALWPRSGDFKPHLEVKPKGDAQKRAWAYLCATDSMQTIGMPASEYMQPEAACKSP